MFNWSSAFAGSISSYLSVGTELFGDGAAAVGGRTLIMAMVGGTTSVIIGGKFEDGVVSATFVHLFNGEWTQKDTNSTSKPSKIEQCEVSRDYSVGKCNLSPIGNYNCKLNAMISYLKCMRKR